MHKLNVVGLSALLALSASACSLVGGGDPEPSAPPPASAPASAPTEPATSAPPSASSAGSASAAPGGPTPADPGQPSGGDLGQAVTTRTASRYGAPITVTVYPVRRSGTTSQLNLAIANPATDKRVQLSSLLADNNLDGIDKSGDTVDGLQLVDGKNSKVYLVASDGNGQCLCSRDMSGTFVGKGDSVLVSATFAAPPADVTSVDLRIPAFGTVSNVPVQ